MGSFTIKENIERVSDKFKKNDLELCLMACIKKDRSFLYLQDSYKLSQSEQSEFDLSLEKLNASMPIAYILGNQPFFSSDFKVNSNVLIPRPETELIISETLNIGDKLHNEKNKIRVLDVGTGSGCIGLSIGKERPEWQITLSDISTKSTTVASENMRALDLSNCQILASNWFNAFDNHIFDVIVSNPPYIDRNSRLIDDGVLKFEPHEALFASQNGIGDIEVIIKTAQRVLKPGGFLIIENGYNQSRQVVNLLEEQDYGDIKVLMDYNKIARFTSSRKNNDG